MDNPMKNRNICRACLKIVEGSQTYGYIEDATGNLRDMLLCCIPEMDIFISLNPIICIQCIHALINFYQFKSRCINTESIIRTYMKKCNLTDDQNQIDLGAVVQDLIEINNFYKKQEEYRRQIAMEQQKYNAENSCTSPFVESQTINMQMSEKQKDTLPYTNPFHYLERDIHDNTNFTMTARQYPQMNQPNFVGPRTFVRFMVPPFAKRFGPPSLVRRFMPPPLLNRGPMHSQGEPIMPILFRSLNEHLRINNGITSPIKPRDLTVQQNNIVSSTTTSEPTIFSHDIPRIEPENNMSNTSQINKQELRADDKIGAKCEDEIGQNKNINNKSSSKESKNKITYHPIESKLRLVIKIPRHKITIPFKEINLLNIEDCDVGKSTSENNNEKEEPMDDSDAFAEAVTADVSGDIAEDYPEYLPEDISKIYNLGKKDEDNSPNFISENDDIEKKNESQRKLITKFYNCGCMYLTTSGTLFEEHKKRCRVGKKSILKCPHCPHVTNRPYALNKHINTMHTKATWFHCQICPYRSTDKSCLRRHVRKNHEDKTNLDNVIQFCCTICNTMISSEHNFNRHMQKHEETQCTTYECAFCSYNSKDRSNYRKHIFTHSPIQLQCPNCYYTNVSPYQLRTHIKKNHNGVGIEAADCRSDIPISEIISDIKEMVNRIEDKQENECS